MGGGGPRCGASHLRGGRPPRSPPPPLLNPPPSARKLKPLPSCFSTSLPKLASLSALPFALPCQMLPRPCRFFLTAAPSAAHLHSILGGRRRLMALGPFFRPHHAGLPRRCPCTARPRPRPRTNARTTLPSATTFYPAAPPPPLANLQAPPPPAAACGSSVLHSLFSRARASSCLPASPLGSKERLAFLTPRRTCSTNGIPCSCRVGLSMQDHVY